VRTDRHTGRIGATARAAAHASDRHRHGGGDKTQQ
jgi:hypothetical protein